LSTESTEPAVTFAVLAPAIEALAYLQTTYPTLPSPYVVLTPAGIVAMQCNTTADFETWRAALGIPPHTVTLHAYPYSVYLLAQTTICGVRADFTCYRLPLSEEQAAAEQPRPEDPCRPCGCPRRFDRHADGCPTLSTPPAAPVVSTLAETHAGGDR